jgi:hypothetical protein
MIDYVPEEIVEWLAGTDNPVVRYLAICEFPHLFTTTPLAAYESMRRSPIVERIANSAIDGIVGDRIRYDLWYRGSVWCFAELVEFGLSVQDPLVAKTAEFIIRTAQLPAGGFTMNWAPPLPATGWTGDILYYLVKSGYKGDGLHRAAQWLIDTQRVDGGWLSSPIRSLRDALTLALFNHVRQYDDDDTAVPSSLLPTLSCARALSLYDKRFGGMTRTLERGTEFILGKGFPSQDYQIGGEMYCANTRFHRIGYPILCQHDIMSVLLYLSGERKLEDDRASRSFNLVMNKVLPDGRFPCESREPGTLHAKYRWRKGKSDKWVTLRTMRLMHAVQNQNA